jgi:hypothetical protein
MADFRAAESEGTARSKLPGACGFWKENPDKADKIRLLVWNTSQINEPVSAPMMHFPQYDSGW